MEQDSMTKTTPPVSVDTFGNLGIAPRLLEILQKQKFVQPTPIQAQSIPPAIEGKDLMGIAQTGTGKTLAFGVPMIQRLAQSQGKMKGLVLLPTRELALQVDATLRKVGSPLGLKTAILIGGESMQKQFRALKQNPHIIIATPGRLIDHIENNRLDITKTGVLVLDEADRMLDMGFAPQIKKVLERLPKERQTMLFSATMPSEIVQIAQSYMTLPLRIEVAPAGSAVKTVTQELFFVDKNRKADLLRNLLIQYKGSILVFSRTKHGARKIATLVRTFGHSATEIHSNRTLNQRIEALEGFKIGKFRILVATDIAARGIDVTGIQTVINFDLPATAEDYVHRIGRTGRAGMTGHAVSFATPDQKYDVRSIERLIRKALPISQTPELKETVLPRDDFKPAFERGRRAPRSEFRPKYKESGHKRRHGSFRTSSSNSNTRSQGPRPARQGADTSSGYFMKRRES